MNKMLAESRKEARKESKKHVAKINRFVSMLHPLGLRRFRNVELLRAMNLKVGCETGTFPTPMPPIPDDLELHSFSVCTDQEQSQITGGEFIFGDKPALACTGVRFSDPFHRWNNDVNMAYAKSGLEPIVKAATLFINIGYGPWQSGAWFHMIINEGHKIAATVPANSQLLLKFWPFILRDQGLQGVTHDAVSGMEARKEYVSRLAHCDLMNLRGTKVSPSAWMSIQIAGHAWNDTLASRALVLASFCIKKSWILTSEDLFHETKLGANSCGDKPAPKSKAAAVREAKAKLENLKQRQQNNMVSATKLLCDVDVVNGFRILLLAGRSQWTGFNAAISQLTSPEKCMQFCLNWAKWGWLDCLHACNDCLSNAAELNRCGIETDFTSAGLAKLTPASAVVQYQNALAMRLQRLQFLIVSLRAGSLVEWCHYYPFRLVLLTSDNPRDVKEGLIEFERDVKAWWQAKASKYVRDR